MASKKTTSALQGATLGGTVGSAFGPVGTIVGGGLGAGIGLIFGDRTSETEKLRKEQLEELLRRQEEGALGLTDEERRMMEASLVDPILAARREQQQANMAALATQDLGAGMAYRQQQGDVQRAAQDTQAARAAIEKAHLDEQRREERQIQDMLKDQQAREDQQRAAQLEAATSLAGTLAAAGSDLMTQAEQQQIQEDLLNASGLGDFPDADFDELNELFGFEALGVV